MLSERMNNLSPYVPGEQPQDGEYIKLNTNENPYPPTSRIKDFLADMDISRLKLYPEPTSALLRDAIAEKEGLKPENVFIGNGSDEVLSFVFFGFSTRRTARFFFPNTHTPFTLFIPPSTISHLRGLNFAKIFQ